MLYYCMYVHNKEQKKNVKGKKIGSKNSFDFITLFSFSVLFKNICFTWYFTAEKPKKKKYLFFSRRDKACVFDSFLFLRCLFIIYLYLYLFGIGKDVFLVNY